MSDPVGERLRSYYASIQGDAPVGLEARVARAFDAQPAGGAIAPRWRPAFALAGLAGLFGLVAVVATLALIFGNVHPVPAASPTPSGTPAPPLTPTPTPTIGPTEPPTATPGVTAPTGQPESPSPEPSPTARPVGSLQDTGAMNPPLSQPVAVRLSDGRVLITGGREKQSNGLTVLRSQAAEIYEAGPGTFTPTGSMVDARAGHTATLLNDGRVLVVGGIDASDGFDNLATAELYDPNTGRFTPTGSLGQGRAHQTATLLNDGRVLIAGGYGGGTLSLASAEIYDPATGRFTATGSMTVARRDATATPLPDGRVLIAGGLDQYATSALASAEIYDPATGKFTATGSMTSARYAFAGAGLEDGRALVAGGTRTTPSSAAVATAEFYDPDTGKFLPAGTLSAAGAFTAVWLKDARILFVSGGALSIYDPAARVFTNIPTGVHIPEVQYQTATWTDSNVLLTEGKAAVVWTP